MAKPRIVHHRRVHVALGPTKSTVLVLLGLVLAVVVTPNELVFTDKTCYENSESIRLFFVNHSQRHNATASDWIALYPNISSSSSLRNGTDTNTDLDFYPPMWLWTCGTQNCSTAKTQGILVFTNTQHGTTNNMRGGEYVAVLTGGLRPPFPTRAVSPIFTVAGGGSTCKAVKSVNDTNDTNNRSNSQDKAEAISSRPCGGAGNNNNNNNNNNNDPELVRPIDNGEIDSTDLAAVIARARLDIEELIAQNTPMGAKFLRLAFQDCVGGCDGTYQDAGTHSSSWI
jgi:hypothetical protein